MATIKICDVCRQPLGELEFEVRTTSGTHPHDNKPISQKIDICPSCLQKIDDLSTDQSVTTLRARLTEASEG